MAQKLTLRQVKAILDSLGAPDGCAGTACGRCACGNEDVYDAVNSVYLSSLPHGAAVRVRVREGCLLTGAAAPHAAGRPGRRAMGAGRR